MNFDLLTTVESGGCSSKLSASKLAEILHELPSSSHPDLLVDIETHDDAGVYRISADTALVQTLDFFPPVCSDPYDFGQIAAANSLSDVYAMGGKPLTAMNIMMFPSSKIPLPVFAAILKGGYDKVTEAGAVIVGGHTIEDYPPKYGLSVTGIIHPDRIITNAAAKDGDELILAKALGTGIAVAARRTGVDPEGLYDAAVTSMKQLNGPGASIMQDYNVRCATDITGFGLLGHALKMARASSVTFEINASVLPIIQGALEMAEMGCLPGASFRNQEFAKDDCSFPARFDHARAMVMFDAQTSGGLFICAPRGTGAEMTAKLKAAGYTYAALIGRVLKKAGKYITVKG
jgi:selenide,water dikinase